MHIPENPVPPARRRSVVREELQEALNALAQGRGAVVDGWQVVALDSTRSIQTVRAMLSRLRRSDNYPFTGWGKVRVYSNGEGTVCLAVRV